MKFISLASISMATLICWDAFIPIASIIKELPCSTRVDDLWHNGL